jgi:hypothetical protein
LNTVMLPILTLLFLLTINIAYIIGSSLHGAYFSLLFIVLGIILANYTYIIHHKGIGEIGLPTYLSAVYFTYGIVMYFNADTAIMNLTAAFIVLLLTSYYWNTGVIRPLLSPFQPIAIFISIFIAVIVNCRDPLWYATLPLYEVIIYYIDKTRDRNAWSKVQWIIYPAILYSFPYTYTSVLFALISVILFYIKTSSRLAKWPSKTISIDILIRPLLSVI